jgi:hypothetical protein
MYHIYDVTESMCDVSANDNIYYSIQRGLMMKGPGSNSYENDPLNKMWDKPNVVHEILNRITSIDGAFRIYTAIEREKTDKLEKEVEQLKNDFNSMMLRMGETLGRMQKELDNITLQNEMASTNVKGIHFQAINEGLKNLETCIKSGQLHLK